MSRFRQVDAGTWGDQRFAFLSQDAKLLWLYLLTGPEVTSLPGVIVIGRAALAEAMRWSTRRLNNAFSELSETSETHPTPMVIADWKTRIVYQPNAHKYRKPKNDLTVVSWREHWRCVPECELKTRIEADIRASLAACGQKYLGIFDGLPPKSRKSDAPVEPSLNKPPLDPSNDSSKGSLNHIHSTSTSISEISEGVQGEEPWQVPDGVVRLERADWIRAYTDGVVAGGAPRSFGFQGKAFGSLRTIVEKNAVGPDRQNIPAWIEREATRFARAVAGQAKFYGAYSPDGMLKWLNEDAAHSAPPPPRTSEIRPTTAPPDEPPLTPEELAAELEKFRTSGDTPKLFLEVMAADKGT